MAPLAAALPAIGEIGGSTLLKGAVMGGGSFGVTKVLGKVFGDDKDDDKKKDDQKPAEQQQAAAAAPAPGAAAPGAVAPGVAAPAGYAPQQPMAGYQAQPAGYASQAGMPSVVPVAAGVGGAGMAMGAGAPEAAAPQAQSVGTRGVSASSMAQRAASSGGDKSFLSSMVKTLAAAGVGGVAGFMMKSKEAEEKGLEGGDRTKDLAKGALAGAGAGVFGERGLNDVQREGGTTGAGLNTGMASALASTLKDGGPGFLSSFGMGAGAGVLSDKVHDSLTKDGNGVQADAVAGAGLGSALGYTGTGDAKMAGLLGLGAGGLGAGAGALDQKGGLGGLLSGLKGDSPTSALEEQVSKIGGNTGPDLGQEMSR